MSLYATICNKGRPNFLKNATNIEQSIYKALNLRGLFLSINLIHDFN